MKETSHIMRGLFCENLRFINECEGDLSDPFGIKIIAIQGPSINDVSSKGEGGPKMSKFT